MSVQGLRLKKELLGESCLLLETFIPPKQAIATTRAFGNKTSNLKLVQEAVATYTTRCAEKLRKQNSVAQYISVFIHTDPFNNNEVFYNRTQTITLPVASNSRFVLSKHALYGLRLIFKPGLRYKKAGVIVSGLSPANHIQGNLCEENDTRLAHLSLVMDNLNSRYGRDTVKMAIQGNGKEWKLRQEKLSPHFTSNWTDIMEVKCM